MSEKKKSFWRSLPGVLTALAAIITAITGLYLAIGRNGGNSTPTQRLILPDVPPTQTIQHAIQTVRLKRVQPPIKYLSHGFFTSKGYIIALKEGIGNATEVDAIWTSDNREQRAVAKVVKQGSLVFQVILLRIEDKSIPPEALPIRVSKSLHRGNRVERYLGPHDRTPGKVLEVGVKRRELLYGKIFIALITTAISGFGDKGAPVIDSEGRVVGMVVELDYKGRVKKTISIPIENIKANFPEAF